MKYQGVWCDRAKKDGRPFITRSECDVCVQSPDHPCPFHGKILTALWGDDDYELSNLALSPTRIQGCMRARYLGAHGAPAIMDPYKAWHAFRGTLAHTLLESVKGMAPGVIREIKEIRFEAPLQTRYGEKKLVGKPDLIEVFYEDDKNIVVKVTDWKSTREIKHDFIEAKEAHQKQVNMYAYLLSKALPSALGRPDLEVVVDELEIVYFTMDKVRRFTSLSELVDRGPILPPRSAEKYKPLDLYRLNHKSLEDMEQHIAEWMEVAIEAETTPATLEDSQSGLCSYCAYKRACHAMYEKEGR